MLAQVWGCLVLVLVVFISPLLVILARNAISTIQVRLKQERTLFKNPRQCFFFKIYITSYWDPTPK